MSMTLKEEAPSHFTGDFTGDEGMRGGKSEFFWEN